MSESKAAVGDAEVHAFVERICAHRMTLTEHDRQAFDSLLVATANGAASDVEAYAFWGAGSKQLALAAVMALGLVGGTLNAPLTGTAAAAPLEQPSLNGNMGGGSRGSGSSGSSGQSSQPQRPPPSTSVNIPNVHTAPPSYTSTVGLTPNQAATLQQQMAQLNGYMQTANRNLQNWNALAPAYQQEYQRAIENVRQQGMGNDPGMDAIFGAATGSSLTQDAQRAIQQLEEQRANLNREMERMHNELVAEQQRLRALEEQLAAQAQAQREAAYRQHQAEIAAANARENAGPPQPTTQTVIQGGGDHDGRVTQDLLNARENNIQVTQPFVDATNDNAASPPGGGRTSQRLTDQFNNQ